MATLTVAKRNRRELSAAASVKPHLMGRKRARAAHAGRSLNAQRSRPELLPAVIHFWRDMVRGG